MRKNQKKFFWGENTFRWSFINELVPIAMTVVVPPPIAKAHFHNTHGIFFYFTFKTHPWHWKPLLNHQTLFSSPMWLKKKPHECSWRLGKNDNHVGKLLGQKMMDEIDFLFSCLQIFLVNFFGNTYVGGVALKHKNVTFYSTWTLEIDPTLLSRKQDFYLDLIPLVIPPLVTMCKKKEYIYYQLEPV